MGVQQAVQLLCKLAANVQDLNVDGKRCQTSHKKPDETEQNGGTATLRGPKQAIWMRKRAEKETERVEWQADKAYRAQVNAQKEHDQRQKDLEAAQAKFNQAKESEDACTEAVKGTDVNLAHTTVLQEAATQFFRRRTKLRRFQTLVQYS